MGASVSGSQFCAHEKGRSGMGKTKVGKGSNVMVVADTHGCPSCYTWRARIRINAPWPRPPRAAAV
jgi:hypothetical protein